MTWREVCEADLEECLGIEPRNLGDEIIGRDGAMAVWRKLIHSPSFNSIVIESSETPGRILAFGASLFVAADVATREIANPRSNLNSRIIAGIAQGDAVIRSEADLYQTDAREPLDGVILYGNWITGVLDEEQLMEVQRLLPWLFVERHLGYRLNRFFSEGIGAQADHMASSGVWRVTARFADRSSQLAVMTRREAVLVSGSLAPSLFRFREPILALRDSERHLLAEALTYRSDVDLAKRMNLSVATVKKRWQALFDRIAVAHPELLPSDENTDAVRTRGPQKRHHVLAYVRSHPEELRPYRWTSIR